jgi:quinol monooxygenase YgiN
MYARTGHLIAAPGKREEFVQILLQAANVVGKLSGCFLYAVTTDLADENVIWVMEIWDTPESHAGSLQNEQVRSLISAAMPLMGGNPSGAALQVIGGHGIPGQAGQNPAVSLENT